MMRRILLVIALGIVLFLGLLFFLASRGIFLFFMPAFPTLSSENCDELKELWQRNKCYLRAADKKGDSSLCEKIVVSQEDETSRANKELCYSNVARNTRNVAICEKAGSQRNYCIEEYAKFHRDKSVCDKISGQQRVVRCKQNIP